MVDDHTDSDALMLQALKSPVADQARAIRLMTPQAEVACRFYTLPGTLHGAMWVGGAGGGWDSPAHGLYPRLWTELLDTRIASLWVRVRHPHCLPDAVFDVCAGIAYRRR